jgi:hypothetical protein
MSARTSACPLLHGQRDANNAAFQQFKEGIAIPAIAFQEKCRFRKDRLAR